MATKFKRAVCICCKKKLVGWKLIPMRNEKKIVFFLCFSCSRELQKKFEIANIKEEPNKKHMLWLAQKRQEEIDKEKKRIKIFGK